MATAIREKNGHVGGGKDLLRLHTSTAHDWQTEKRIHKDFYDDGTLTFFWRAHTITALVVFSIALVYVALFEVPTQDKDFNAKRGLTAICITFLLFGIINTPDGPFVRPHPVFWRLILCLSIMYELALVFLLFQNVKDARELIRHFDSSLGQPLPEKDYGGHCLIYDSNHTDPWHNLQDKLDGFVPTHFFGWWLKTLVLRDWWLCTVMSIMFEVLEYTLEHQLPNFSECWWDHWIMDAFLCNGLGIYLGMKTLNYLSMKPYHWRGMWNMPTYGGMLKRMAQQFTPYSWTDYDWKPTSSLKRWLSMLCVISIFLLAELNTFYLKFVLWIPPEHYLCLGRLVFFLFMGAAAMREVFQFLDDPNCKRFGRQSWVIAAIIITEFLIVLKFDWNTVTKPLPQPIAIFWVLGLLCLVGWTVLKFYILKDVKHDIPKIKDENVNDISINSNNNNIVSNALTSAKLQENGKLQSRARKNKRKD
jgi:phosphatidylserine synthase 2